MNEWAVTLPVTVKDPVGIITVPNKVWVSSAVSPNWFEPEEYPIWFIINVLIEAVPRTVTFPVMVPPTSGRYSGANKAVDAYEDVKAYEAETPNSFTTFPEPEPKNSLSLVTLIANSPCISEEGILPDVALFLVIIVLIY